MESIAAETSTLKKGDELDLEIESVTFGGQGVARLDEFVIFVDGAVPGDRVNARILKKKKNFAEARTLSVLKPSSDRIPAVCGHFGICGGCKWQDVGYDAQLEFKRRNIQDVFQRIGGFEDLEIPVPLSSPKTFHYRNKMEFTFGDVAWRVRPDDPDEPFALGLHVPQRFDKILNIDACHLQTPLANEILNFVKQFAKDSGLPPYSVSANSGFWRFLVLRQMTHTGHLMVHIITYEEHPSVRRLSEALSGRFPQITSIINGVSSRLSQVAFSDRQIVLYGSGVISEKLDAFEFEISANSFFQTNTLGAEVLYRTIREFAALTGVETVFDLYGGTGSIAIYLAQKARKIIGVELVESAVLNAKANAERNGVKNCEFLCGDLRETLTRLKEKPDLIILDPPRSGAHEDVIRTILDLAPPHVVYVSCNPATQARDLALMKTFYTIDRVQPVDMFPHTYHVENIVSLRRRP